MADRYEAAENSDHCPECNQEGFDADTRECEHCGIVPGPVAPPATPHRYTFGQPVTIIATGAHATVVALGPAMEYRAIPSYLVRVGHARCWKTEEELASN